MTKQEESIDRIKQALEGKTDPLLIFDENLLVKSSTDKEANGYSFSNPPRYAIMTWINYEDTAVVGLFPKVNPRDPQEKTTEIAIAPDNLTHQELVDIYETLLEVKPTEVVEVQIIHLSDEQIATIVACSYDQDELFSFLYENEDAHNDFFDTVTPVLVVRNIEDIPKESMDAILTQQRCLQGAFTRSSE